MVLLFADEFTISTQSIAAAVGIAAPIIAGGIVTAARMVISWMNSVRLADAEVLKAASALTERVVTAIVSVGAKVEAAEKASVRHEDVLREFKEQMERCFPVPRHMNP